MNDEAAGPVCVDCLRDRRNTGTCYFREDEVERLRWSLKNADEDNAVLKAEVERLREQLRLRAAGVAERVTAELRAENERLREENERLRNQVEGLLSVEFENRRENERLREVWNVSDRIRAENERLRANQCDCLEGPRQAATGATGG